MSPAFTPAVAEAVEAVWRQRAARLARRPLTSFPGQSAVLVMAVVIAGERYGIDLPDVIEILPPIALTLVPGAPSALAGVINVHGEIRPVAALQRMLGIATTPQEGLVRVVLLRQRGRTIGLAVDSVDNILSITVEELQRSDDGYQGLPVRYLKGTTRDMLRLLRTESLFSELLEGVTT